MSLGNTEWSISHWSCPECRDAPVLRTLQRVAKSCELWHKTKPYFFKEGGWERQLWPVSGPPRVVTWHWPRRCRLLNNSLSTGVSQYFGNKIRGATNATLLNEHTKWCSTPKNELENKKQKEERERKSLFFCFSGQQENLLLWSLPGCARSSFR